MKKYRYGDPTQIGIFRKYGNFLYFFAAWNLLAFVAWKSISAKKGATDEDWDKKTGSEKYLSVIGFGRDNKEVKRVKIEGLHIQDGETSTEKN